MNSLDRIDTSRAPLSDGVWPLAENPDHLPSLLRLNDVQLRQLLEELARRSEGAGDHVIHEALASTYAYLYGYGDSPVATPDGQPMRNTLIEQRLATARLRLEDAVLDGALGRAASSPTGVEGQEDLADFLRSLMAANGARDHDLFSYLADDAGDTAMRRFLFMEVVRNEVVDDEVALLTIGLQGSMKAAASLNLADEAGIVGNRARLEAAHTYWLRELLAGIDRGGEFLAFRRSKPWFVSLTSNVFNMLLLRSGLKPAAYGHFALSESWVAPHFGLVLAGMERHGLTPHAKYFVAHQVIDPGHSDELVDAVVQQVPRLDPQQASLVAFGAQLAVTAATRAYDEILQDLVATEDQ